MPAAIRSSIILSHWGRKDANHTSDSGYHVDVYSNDMSHPQFEPDGFLRKIRGWPCYDPVKVGRVGGWVAGWCAGGCMMAGWMDRRWW